MRLAIILANTAVWALNNESVALGPWRMTLFTLMGVVVLVVLFVFYCVFGEIERRKLSRLDPPPPAGDASPPVAAAERRKEPSGR